MPALKTLFIDLDDTLYPSNSGVWPAISERIDLYLINRLAIGPQKAQDLRRRYRRSFGTTLAGLMADHEIDPADYLQFVHDVPIERYVKADPALAYGLAGLPHAKWVFTNASRRHAQRVLAALGLAGTFQGVIAIEDLDYRNKPDLVAYRRALKLAGAVSSAGCLLADDRWQNLKPARQLGMHTVLVGHRSPDQEGVDHWIDQIGLLPSVVQDLTRLNGRSHARRT